jgi:hypothetical protein
MFLAALIRDALASEPDYPTQVNPRHDLIVRKPFRTDKTFILI